MKTKYIVCLKKGATSLEILGTQEAHSGEGAIRAQAGGTDGRYVAVPLSNWHEVDNAIEIPEPRAKLTPVEPVFPGQVTIDDALGGTGEFAPKVEDEPAAA